MKLSSKFPHKFGLVLIGNFASGKSSVARILAQEWGGVAHFSLDHYREKQFHANRMSAENQAKVQFRKDLLQAPPHLIYESTYSTFDQANFRQLKANRYILFFVKIHCSLQECRRRFEQRGERYLFGTSVSAMEMISNLHVQLQGVKAHQVVDSECYSSPVIASQISFQITSQVSSEIASSSIPVSFSVSLK